MHALVLGLLHERADPAAVVLEAAERAQVQQHAAHHGWHRRDRLQQQRVAGVPALEEEVAARAQRPHDELRHLVRHRPRLVVLGHVHGRVRPIRVPRPEGEPRPLRAVVLDELPRLDAPVARHGLLVLLRRCCALGLSSGFFLFGMRACGSAGYPRGEDPRGGGHDAPRARGESGRRLGGDEEAGAQVAQ
uniref:Uncharacterized protein n=1 Tax=Triticum urartu TaxID=4572 RepID=A0A8R7UB58_TRIUA